MSVVNLEYTDKILNGDVIEQLQKLPGDLVDCVVTSPPYWGLRDYGVDGQIGLEQHPKEYIAKITAVFNEVRRVLKPTGTVFLNIGDTYFGSNVGAGDSPDSKNYLSSASMPAKSPRNFKTDDPWLKPKQRLMIPERIAIAMQESGWVLRNNIIWHKPNHMPSSVEDRLTSSYESVFLFTKSREYYFNLDAIRRPHLWASKDKRSQLRRVEGKSGKITEGKYATNAVGYHPLGANPGDVWDINTEPSFAEHFATFPTSLVKRCLLCGCPKEGLVLDPFTGSGTTLFVARSMALHYLGIELNSDYVEIARAIRSGIIRRLLTR